MASFLPAALPFSDLNTRLALASKDTFLETQLNNKVRVYGDPAAVEQISQLLAEYSSIWESGGFVQILPERWMKVPLIPDWESKVSIIKPKVYPLGNESRRLVDKTFDKMYRQGRLKFTTKPTPFCFPVFIIWKIDVEGEKKGHVVVNIWKLNDIVLPDSYPLPLQSDIITNV